MCKDVNQLSSVELELAHLYERAPIGLCVTDRQHRYVRINQRLCEINGKTMEEHVGHTIREVIPHIAEPIVSMFQKVIDSAEPVRDYEVRGQTQAYPGEERIFLGNHYPLLSKAGKVMYVHTMVQDITERKRAEILLEASKADLEERVKERTAELTRVTAQLKVEARDRIKAQEELHHHQVELAYVSQITSMGELAASIAHELNQPLTAILTNAQAALRFMKADNPDIQEINEILQDIVSDSNRGGQVIQRLRGLLQKRPVTREDVQLDELVDDLVTLIRADALAADVRIDVESAPNLPPVEADPVQLQQVLMNLLMNAVDAIRGSESDGGNVRVEISTVRGESIMVAVRDNGQGIPAENIGKVFNPFFTTKLDGLGIGLAICKTIVDAHDGTISVESIVPHGCCFAFVLPLKSTSVSLFPAAFRPEDNHGE